MNKPRLPLYSHMTHYSIYDTPLPSVAMTGVTFKDARYKQTARYLRQQVRTYLLLYFTTVSDNPAHIQAAKDLVKANKAFKKAWKKLLKHEMRDSRTKAEELMTNR